MVTHLTTSVPFLSGLQPLRDVGERRLPEIKPDVRHAGDVCDLRPGLGVQREARLWQGPRSDQGVCLVGPGQQDCEGGSDRGRRQNLVRFVRKHLC